MVGHADAVRSLAFSPDGNLLASGGCAKTRPVSGSKPTCVAGELRFWQTTGRLLAAVQGDTEQAITSVAFSPDGTRLASGVSSEKLPRVWAAVYPGVKVNSHYGSISIPDNWLASYVRPLRYTVLVGASTLTEIGSCAYTASHWLVRRIESVKVTITDEKLKRAIRSTSFRGSSPEPCPASREFYTTIEYEDGWGPDTDTIESWIMGQLRSLGVK